MRVQKTRSLFAIALCTALLPAILPLPGSLLCPRPAQSHEDREYREGNQKDGDNGRSGRNGAPGRNGDDRTISATGTPVNLDLSGRDGGDGGDGERGERPPYCLRQSSNEKHDLNAPAGGHGGSGGHGGDGGRGGNLTVYYNNLSDLRQIFVRSTGGEGGRGGNGGRGGRGCNCTHDSWTVETCKGTPGSADYSCKKKTYRCRDGADGPDGSDGAQGQTGARGQLSLIKGNTPLLADQPVVELPLSRFQAGGVNLSLNKWITRQGATGLLAPGSVLADEYREFVERIEGSFQLVWNDKAALAGFSDQMVTASLRDRGQVQLTFPDDLWVDGTLSQAGDRTLYTVSTAIRKQDVTRLSVADFTQAGKNLQLSLVDLGGRADLLTTEFRLKYRAREYSITDRFAQNYETHYNGVIPTTAVTRDHNRYLLNLGQLPIPSNALAKGTDVEIELAAVRRLGDRTATQAIRWDGVIRGDR